MARSREVPVNCPDCGSDRSKVTSTWRAGKVIRRRRECLECGLKFDTRQEIQAETTDQRAKNCHNGNNPHGESLKAWFAIDNGKRQRPMMHIGERPVSDGKRILIDVPLTTPLDEIVNEAIRQAVTLCDGNVARAARRLDIGGPQVARRMKKLARSEARPTEPAEPRGKLDATTVGADDRRSYPLPERESPPEG